MRSQQGMMIYAWALFEFCYVKLDLEDDDDVAVVVDDVGFQLESMKQTKLLWYVFPLELAENVCRVLFFVQQKGKLNE